jgi:hypothetical protein
VREGDVKSFVIKVTDAAGAPLAGYVVELDVANPANFGFVPTGPGPRARHGRVPSGGLHRATDADGVVVVSFQAPTFSTAASNMTVAFKVVYQPDFDIDAALAPPQPGDDLETLLRKHYLSSLRGAAKIWSGSGNNFGARVTRTVNFTIQRRPQAAAVHYSGRVEGRSAVPEDLRAASDHHFLGAGQAFEVLDRGGAVVASGVLDAAGRFDVALPAGQLFELRLTGFSGLRT